MYIQLRTIHLELITVHCKQIVTLNSLKHPTFFNDKKICVLTLTAEMLNKACKGNNTLSYLIEFHIFYMCTHTSQ